MFENKIILITGGTGSCGRRLIKRLIPLKPKEIRIFSRDEKKQYDIRHEFENQKNLKFIIGDIRDKSRILEATKDVDIIFHTAAMKHVNICEVHPFEAVKTNILGTQNVIEAAMENKVEKLVALSTDKAVKPLNAMGISKAMEEKLVIQANFSPANRKTRFSCVRYGNVVDTRGTVIPFFRSLFEKNKTITITDPAMTRFLLTLNDAIDLIFFAAEHMKGGEIFVKKAPSANILDLAKIIHKEEYPSITLDYKVIGKYPGEKIHEILIAEDEISSTEDKGSYFVIHPAPFDVNIKNISKEYTSQDDLCDERKIAELLKKSLREEKEEIVDGLYLK